MIVDFFTGTGHWPFRKLRHADIRGLMALLGSEGIDGAFVYPISSILAKDCMEGNREVHQAAQDHPSTIIPLACVNPAFPGWEADFAECFEKMGFRGLRLFPTYHGYRLEERFFHDVVEAAEEKQIPLILSVRIEDERQHHWLVKVPPLDLEAAAGAIADFPRTTFVLSGATYPELYSARQSLEHADNWYFDIARMQGRHDNPGPVEVLVRAIDDFGAERILFGSNAPFQYIRSSLLKVLHAPIGEDERDLILFGNAMRLLAGGMRSKADGARQ
ncbi:MAG: amidohydrolase [Phycisphaerales bacterium]|nr:amidohydrolase [Phycisphaerales bacterium]